MQLSSFWPPRATLDRTQAELYRRRNAELPWVTRDAIKLMDDLVKHTDRCLEWGSGSSTIWLSSRAASLVSVEHDRSWFDQISTELRKQTGRGSVRLLSAEPRDQPTSSPYVRVVDEFEDAEVDFCFIDGEHRAACALAVLPKLASGSVLVIDDAHSRLDHRTTSPHSRYRRGPVDGDWARFEGLIRDWRLIWTSDGYSDTAFWFKP